MFEVRCIVGDKKLSDVLRALKGHTIEHPVVIPVDDRVMSTAQLNGMERAEAPPRAKWKPNRKKPVQFGGKHLKDAGSTQIVRDLIANSGAVRISAREMKQATLAAGYSSGAYSHAIKLLTADKTIRPLPTKGDYEVLRSTQAHEAIQHG